MNKILIKQILKLFLITLLIFSCDKNPVSDKVIIVEIQDPILDKAIRDKIKKPTGPLEASDLKKIEKLEIAGKIENLKGIEYCCKLKTLKIHSSEITNIGPIEQLITLEYLNINNNKLDDLSGLENLKKLRILSLNNNSIDDITPITNLKKLEILSANYNHIEHIPNLSKMVNLQYVLLNHNQVTSIVPFICSPAIHSLNLFDNKISDLSPVYDSECILSGRTINIALESNPLDDNSVENIIPDLKKNYKIGIVH